MHRFPTSTERCEVLLCQEVTKKIPVRDEFLILTNGKRSEKNYFEALRSEFKTIYKIKVKFMNDAPETLVSHAIDEKSKTNRVWCVFDKDQFSKESIYQAIALAKQYGIGIAFSNISFEVWLMDHFAKCENEKTVDRLIKELDSILQKHGYPKGYSKDDADVFKSIFVPLLDDATHNADVVHQKRVLEHRRERQDDNYPICDWNSYTNVHKLVEAMKLQNKNKF